MPSCCQERLQRQVPGRIREHYAQDIDPDGRKLNEMAEDPEGILQLWRNSRWRAVQRGLRGGTCGCNTLIDEERGDCKDGQQVQARVSGDRADPVIFNVARTSSGMGRISSDMSFYDRCRRIGIQLLSIVQEEGLIKEGDNVVFTSGIPLGVPGSTNLVQVYTVGKIIGNGLSLIKKKIRGAVCKAETPEE